MENNSKKIGLYFGTYNPIHIGHLAIAGFILENSDIDELWFVPTPVNPDKVKQTNLDFATRLHLISLSIQNHFKMRVIDIENTLPKPNYTYYTMAVLTEKYPDINFHLIMGEDNFVNIHKWKNFDLIKKHPILVYPRHNVETKLIDTGFDVKMVSAPKMEISSSMIRNQIAQKKDASFYLHEKVWEYISNSNLYS